MALRYSLNQTTEHFSGFKIIQVARTFVPGFLL